MNAATTITTGTLTITPDPTGPVVTYVLRNVGREVGRFLSLEGAQRRAIRSFGESATVTA